MPGCKILLLFLNCQTNCAWLVHLQFDWTEPPYLISGQMIWNVQTPKSWACYPSSHIQIVCGIELTYKNKNFVITLNKPIRTITSSSGKHTICLPGLIQYKDYHIQNAQCMHFVDNHVKPFSWCAKLGQKTQTLSTSLILCSDFFPGGLCIQPYITNSNVLLCKEVEFKV